MRKRKKSAKAQKPLLDKSDRKSTLRNKEMFLSVYQTQACNISRTCELAKISRETYYQWRKQGGKYYDKDFNRQCTEIEESLDDIAESQLFKNLTEGKEQSLFFWLKNRRPKKWKDRSEVGVKGELKDVGANIIIIRPDGKLKDKSLLRKEQFANRT